MVLHKNMFNKTPIELQQCMLHVARKFTNMIIFVLII